jgi:hypothetical protein
MPHPNYIFSKGMPISALELTVLMDEMEVRVYVCMYVCRHNYTDRHLIDTIILSIYRGTTASSAETWPP